MITAKSASGKSKVLMCTDEGELKVLLCGVQADGSVRPVKVDDEGRLIMTVES